MKALRRAAALLATLFVASVATAQDIRSIDPGMTENEVRNNFGDPAGIRSAGEFTYFFYENSCLQYCGFPDLVIFQGGQVIDAVIRATYREYAGESSSPKGIWPRLTLGGEDFELPGRVEGVEVRPAVPPAPPPELDEPPAEQFEPPPELDEPPAKQSEKSEPPPPSGG